MDDKSRVAHHARRACVRRDGAAAHPAQYHLGDHLGSSGLVVSAAGEWINREEFFPYGETSFGSFGRKRYRFTGRKKDDETDLCYFGFRYFHVGLARWIGCDPLGCKDALGLYRYCQNSPMRMVDDTGGATTASALASQEGAAEVGKIVRHLRLVPSPPPVASPPPVPAAVAGGLATVVGFGLVAIVFTV